MKFIDYIRESLNPQIAKKYKDLFDNHGDAVRLYCQGDYRDPSRKTWRPKRDGFPIPNKDISFKWKKKLIEDSITIQNWYLEETAYRKGCSYAQSHPYGLTIALRKLSLMPKDAPTPYLPEWKESGSDSPFPPTNRKPLTTSYKKTPFCLIEGKTYKLIDWQQVELWETEARNLIKRIEIERKKKEEEEKRKKEEEERKRKENELRTKRTMLTTAESKGWTMVKGIHHYFFYYYYPKKFEDVTYVDQYVRNLIWNFKAGRDHRRVCRILATKLHRIYNKALDILTFVCIPASTCEANRKRYQSFTTDVCKATGMENGYEHITIIKEKEPAHLGGTSSAEYSYDKDFFNGRQVILFDDVVTRGHSLAKMKAELENVGAHIVAALSIGQTYSDYHGNIRKSHPWIIENQSDKQNTTKNEDEDEWEEGAYA